MINRNIHTINARISYIGGESNLTALQGISQSDKELALNLIKAMISEDPSERPPALAVYNHPLFWEPIQILGFFQVCKVIAVIIRLHNRIIICIFLYI